MKEYIYYWTSRPSKDAIRVKAIVAGELSLEEHLSVALLKNEDVNIIVLDGKTREELFSGNYEKLCEWLEHMTIHEVRMFGEGVQHKHFYLTLTPPIKG